MQTVSQQSSHWAEIIYKLVPMRISQTSRTSLSIKSGALEPVLFSNQRVDRLPRTEQEQKPPLDNQLSPNPSINNASPLRQREKLKQKQSKDVTEFANAWKSECGLGILIIEKISQIIHNYFKILPELSKREEENEILIVYNKGLLQILDKFQSHERKIINKLRSMEQFNVKIMKQLCHIKNKPFKPPQIKNQESMFAKFSLNNFAFNKQEKEEEKIDQMSTKALFDIFKKFLLKKNGDYLPLVEAKIAEFKQQGKGQEQRQLLEKDQLNSLIELRNKINLYEESLKNVTDWQVFNLYELKTAIRSQLKNLHLYPPQASFREQEKQDESQSNFVSQVAKISASLAKMDETQLQNRLKTEIESRKKLKKHRLREQEKFLRTCESVQSENIQLSHDIIRFRQKIASLENQLNVIKAEYDYKKMKIRNQPNRSSMTEQSMIEDDANMKSSNKKLVKQTHRAMNFDFKKIKEENEKLQETISEYKGKELSRMLILPKLRQKASRMEISLDPNWEQIKIIQFLLTRIGQINKQKKSSSGNGDHDELVSPSYDDRSIYGFQVNPVQYLNTIPEKSQFDADILENRNKQLEKQVSELRKKNQEYKIMVTGKSQDLRRVLEEHQSTLKQKNGKINQLVKEYERFQAQIKELKLQNQVLWIKWEYALKLAENLSKTTEEYQQYEFGQTADSQTLKNLLVKIQNLNEQFKVETKRQQENYEQKRHISLIRAGDDEISSKHGNSNDQSVASMKKRQSDMFSIQSKDDEHKSKPKLKNLKSLNNNNDSNSHTNYIENQLEKQLSLKKLMNKSSDKSKEKSKDRDPQKSKDRDSKQKFKFGNGKKEMPNKKSDSQNSRFNDKQLIKDSVKESMKQEMKKMEEFSSDSFENNLEKKKDEKKSSTQMGLLKIEQVEGRQKITRTQQSVIDEKGMKSESYQNKKSSSSNSHNINNKDAKEMSNILSELENNHDFADSVSERPKETFKEQFKQQAQKQKQDKKNKVNTNDALKGSSNLQIFRRKQISQDKKNKEEARKQEKKLNTQKNTEKNTEKNNQIEQNNLLKQLKQGKKPLQLLKESRIFKSGIRQSQGESKIEKSMMMDNSRKKNSFRLESDQSSSITAPIIVINNVTRRQTESQLAIEQANSEILNERSVELDYSKDQKSSIKNLLNEPPKNPNDHLHRSQTYERIAQITVEEHEKIMARIEKLGDMDDVLDFIELYNRYKQVLICLDEAEAHIRSIYLRYEKFVDELTKKQQTTGYSIEDELFYLKELVQEQREQIENFDKQCNENMKLNIQKSDSMIKEHLRMMRDHLREEKIKELSQRKLFL